MNRSILAVTLLFSAFASCKVDDDVPDVPVTPPLDLSSQYYTDVNAQPTGSVGNPEDLRQESWEDWVKAHFSALDTATLPAGTATSDSIERVSVFPNPGNNSRAMYVLGLDTINVKLVLVDRQRAAKWKATLNIQSSSNSAFFAMQFPASTVAGDSLYRLYYAFSLAGSPYFHTAHTDITVRP